MVFEYIQERFRTAYKYFACPQRQVTGGCQRNKKAGNEGAKTEAAEKEGTSEEEGKRKGDKSPGAQREHLGSEVGEEPESEEEDGSGSSTHKVEKTLDATLMDMILSEDRLSVSPNGLLDSDKEGEEDNEDKSSDSSEDLHYVFDKMIFTGGKVVVRIISMIFIFWGRISYLPTAAHLSDYITCGLYFFSFSLQLLFAASANEMVTWRTSVLKTSRRSSWRLCLLWMTASKIFLMGSANCAIVRSRETGAGYSEELKLLLNTHIVKQTQRSTLRRPIFNLLGYVHLCYVDLYDVISVVALTINEIIK